MSAIDRRGQVWERWGSTLLVIGPPVEHVEALAIVSHVVHPTLDLELGTVDRPLLELIDGGATLEDLVGEGFRRLA